MRELSRRAFLGLAATSAAAFALDPERLLWVPGAKTIFLPPERTVVAAGVGDIEAFIAGVGAPFFPDSVWRGAAPLAEAMRWVTDAEHALLVARGRRAIAERTKARTR